MSHDTSARLAFSASILSLKSHPHAPSWYQDCAKPPPPGMCDGKPDGSQFVNPNDCRRSPCASTYVVCKADKPTMATCEGDKTFSTMSAKCIGPLESCQVRAGPGIPRLPLAIGHWSPRGRREGKAGGEDLIPFLGGPALRKIARSTHP